MVERKIVVAKNVSNKVGESLKEDCGCYAEGHTKKTCPPTRNITHPLRYYEFTQEEMKALEECDRESFFYRCLPLSTLFASTTYYAVKVGYMQRNPHFGVVPKLCIATFLGYVIGRAAYIPVCGAKLRKLPQNSYLGNVMRKHYADRNP